MNYPIRHFETPNRDYLPRADVLSLPRHSLRVLVVDDDQELCELYKLALEGLGCDCDTANDGGEALTFCARYDYDLVIMDYRMPGMNGCETTERIRCSRRNDKVPIVGCTGEEVVRERCFASGMNAFLVKPVSIVKLMSVLSYFVPESVEAQ
jgi:CheY-like chemotaxis protein